MPYKYRNDWKTYSKLKTAKPMVSELQWKKALLFREANSPVSWDTQQGSELSARRLNATNKLLDFETSRNPNLHQENKPESDLRVLHKVSILLQI